MKNVLITIISLWKENSKPVTYKEDGGTVKAHITSEACCKHVINQLEQDEELDYVISFLTGQVLKKQGEKSTYKKFKDSVRDFCGEKGKKVPKFEGCQIKNKAQQNNEFSDALNEAMDRVRKLDENPRNVCIYFDMASGLRNISVLIEQLTKFFTYYGYTIKSYYTYYDLINNETHEDSTFFDCQNLYKQMDILDGVNEFVTRGSAKKLQMCYENVEDGDVKELLEYMGEFTDEIELCRVDNLNDTLSGMNNALKRLKENRNNGENVFLLRQMIPLIERKFYGGEKIDYLGTIKWCLANGLIQQAMTIYVEKVPEYLFEKGILSVDKESRFYEGVEKEVRKNPMKTDVYSTLFYEEIQQESVARTWQLKIDKYFPGDARAINSSDKNIEQIENEIEGEEGDIKDILRDLLDIWKGGAKLFDKDSTDPLSEKIREINTSTVSNEKKAPENFGDLVSNLKKRKRGTIDNESQVYVWLGVKQDTIYRKILMAQSFDINNMDSHMALNTSVENIQEILYNYSYIKAVRNRTNHAQDDANTGKRTKQFFNKKDYPDIDSLTPTKLAKTITSFINTIESIETN